MAKTAKTYVHARNEKGELRVFGPGDSIPKDFQESITNPKVYGDEEPHATPGGEDEVPQDYSDMTNDELRAILESRDLSQDGNKADLIARLQDDDEES